MKFRDIKVVVILALSVTSNLILAPLTWGSITISNLTHFKYDLNNNADLLETNFFFNGKINDYAYAYATLQYTTSVSAPTAPTLSYGLMYFTYSRPQLGKFTVGCFDYYMYNVSFLIVNPVDKLKSNFGVKYEYPIGNFSVKGGYFPDEHYNSDFKAPPARKSVVTTGLSYKDNNFNADLNALKVNDLDQIAYNANLSLGTSNSIIKSFIHYCSDYDQNTNAVLGLTFNIPLGNNPLVLSAEYNFTDDPPGSNLFGYYVSYRIDQNIYISYFRCLSTINQKNELRISISLY